MPKITVHDINARSHEYEGGNLKPQVAPGSFLVVDFDKPIALFNLDFVEWVDIAD